MYKYDEYDQKIVNERVAQFRDQTKRFYAGELTEEEFLALRLQNGLYVQRLAPMLRIAVPYGMLSSTQLRKLADLTRKFDKGYAHFTTRQNVQFNWPKMEDVPDILEELASVEMHAIQTSGNCIRNTTTDQHAGVNADEIVDPRPYCEIIRQWSTFHPEFAFLPRKFKIAVNSVPQHDRAAIMVHDIGIQIVRNDAGDIGYRVFVGGGLGRTPVIGSAIREFLPEKDLLTYLEAILRVYNRYGRRDNKYKARIKILVKAMTPEVFAEKVEAEWVHLRHGDSQLTEREINRVKSYFTEPAYEALENDCPEMLEKMAADKDFKNWVERNTEPHKQAGYRSVTLTLKQLGTPPGDVSDKQLETIAQLADEFSFGEVRVSHNQNVVLADVRQKDLFDLWQKALQSSFATPTLNMLTDITCCPGGDYCSLANAKSIPVAEQIQAKFDNLDYVYDLKELELNISGCMNACGHHHVGSIGILGVDKKGLEYYQISIGGSSGRNKGTDDADIGKILGPSFARDEVPNIIEKLVDVYVENRTEEELFVDTYRRIGIKPFKERVYAQLIKNEQIVDDEWNLVTDSLEAGQRLPDDKNIVPLNMMLEGEDHFDLSSTGIWLDSHEEPEALDGDINRFPVIAIRFPKFGDGRGYSIARLLRERFGYSGEIRAFGDVLQDQLFYMQRCGFNAFQIREDRSLEKALESLTPFTTVYQTAADKRRPVFRQRG